MSDIDFENSTYSLQQIKQIFATHNIASHDTRNIICDVLSISHTQYFTDQSLVFSNRTQLNMLGKVLKDIVKEVPVQYAIGHTDFWKFTFKVTNDVLIPRPETELIVEQGLKYFKKGSSNGPSIFGDENVELNRILDLGTGSGILAICLQSEFPNAHVTACDISEKALQIARYNASEILGVNHCIRFLQSNWYKALDASNSTIEPDEVLKFQLIVSNPPYISLDEYQKLDVHIKDFEPKIALTDSDTGLLHYIDIIQGAKRYLAADGLLMLEHGSNQSSKLNKLLIENGFKIVDNVLDLAKLDRIIIARYENH